MTGKAQRYYNELNATQKADVKEVFKKLPEFYMNLFYVRTLKPNESVSAYCNDIQHLLEKAMPGLEETTRDKFLKSRLISVVPESVKNFLEMLSDKTWAQLVAIFDKSTDYKSILPADFAHEVAVNKFETSGQDTRRVVYDERYRTRTPQQPRRRFNGECFHCHEIGHRQSECTKKTEAMRSRQPQGYGGVNKRFRQHDNRQFTPRSTGQDRQTQNRNRWPRQGNSQLRIDQSASAYNMDAEQERFTDTT